MIIKIAKGFNDKLQCNPNGTPFQFEVGKEYAEPFASLCSHGFHGCENPIDCFTYYPPGTSRYCDAELDATTETKSEDTKRVGKHIKIGAEIGIKGIIDGTIKFIFDKCNSSSETTATTGDRANAATTGCSANAATTGDRANAATTGCRANAATTGCSANAATTGYRANAATTGCRANAATTGCSANAATTGYRANAATTGYSANAATTGYRANAATTGYSANAATTGDRANAATTGCSANAATTGYRANAATTGYRANAATTGCRANAATTGYSANAATTGYRANASVFNGVAAAIGINGAAKGKLGCFIMLAEWIEDDDYNWVLKTAKSHKVDNKTIMEDVYYKLENGKFIEAEI